MQPSSRPRAFSYTPRPHGDDGTESEIQQAILAAFRDRQVLIIGDIMLDEYLWGEVRRISPEAPVPVVEVQRRTYVPGGAANTAANVVGLGGRALLGGTIGSDHAGEKLREALLQCGIEVEGLVPDETRPTTTKTRIVAHNQQVVRVDVEQRGSVSARVEGKLLQWAEAHVGEVDACILSDYAKGVISDGVAQHVIHLARRAGKPLIVDPKGTNYTKYRGASVVTPNVQEAGRAVNHEINGSADLLEVGWRLLETLQGSALLITRGPQGVSLFRQGYQAVHIPAAARNVYDVTGAGDTVVSTLAMAVAAGAALEQAARLANCAAGIVVGKFGTAVAGIEELSRAIGEATI